MYRNILNVFLIATFCAVLFLAARFLLVEPDDMANACVAEIISISCKLRNAAIYGFSRHLFGPVSLAAAVLAAVGALRWFAALAMLAGMAGMVLYDFDMAAVGFLSGALLFLRFSMRTEGQGRPSQQ